MMQELPKLPPHSKEAEKMVLGCMLTSTDSLTFAAETLNESDFYSPEHQIIFRALKAVYNIDKAADVFIITEHLRKRNELNSVGGQRYLTDLAQFAGTGCYMEEYTEQVINYSLLRRICDASLDLQRDALNSLSDPSELLHKALDTFKEIDKGRNTKDKFPIIFLNEFQANPLFIEPEKKPMLLEYLDAKGRPTGYLPKNIVAMLVGAGGVGKTHLLAQLAISIATGTPFLNTFTTTLHCGAGKMGNVFMGLGENQIDDIARILHKASKDIRSKDKSLLEEASKRIAPFSFCGQNATFIEKGKPTRYFRDLKRRLEDTSPEGGWSLIILDPVSRLLGADAETDNAAATQFIAILEELTIELPGNPTILFAHHTNKAAQSQGGNQNQSASRGASGITDGARLQINLVPEEIDDTQLARPIILKMTKTNFTALLDPIYLQKDDAGYLVRHKEEDKVKELIKKKAKKPITQPFQDKSRKSPGRMWYREENEDE